MPMEFTFLALAGLMAAALVLLAINVRTLRKILRNRLEYRRQITSGVKPNPPRRAGPS